MHTFISSFLRLYALVKTQFFHVRGSWQTFHFCQKSAVLCMICGCFVCMLGVTWGISALLLVRSFTSNVTQGEVFGVYTETQPQEVSSVSGVFQSYVVNVIGEVKNPGVYQMLAGQRVADAIASAGGLLKTAALRCGNQSINLAKKLTDEMDIYIPDNSDCEESGGGVLGTSIDGKGTTTQLSINSVPLNMLLTIKGIGDARAAKIIESRPFASIQDLIQRTGLSEDIVQ